MVNGSRSSAGDSHTAVRWLVPSVGDLIFAALLGLMTCTNLSVRLLGDAGIGWHIRTGQMILATHAIPRVDPFSSIAARGPWYAWEWLYDLVVGWMESVAGLNGVVLFAALILAGLFAWAFRLLLRRGTNIVVALALILLAVSAAMIHFQARPHVVSWFLTVVWFWILESQENWRAGSHFDSFESSAIQGRRLSLWLLPVLMLFWVNLHGGFLVGFVLVAIHWIGAVWQWFSLKGARLDDVLQKIRAGHRIRALTWTGILSAAATFANPYSFRLHVHIYRYLSNHFLMDHIDEFQSPNFHYVAQKCFAGLLLLTLMALAANRRKASVSEGLVVLFAVYSGLYASRNIPVSSLLLILVIGPWLSEGMGRLAEGRRGAASTSFLLRMKTIELSLTGHVWPVAAIALTCWIAAHGCNLGSTPMMDAHFDAKRFPVHAVDYLEKDYLGKNDVPGPLVGPDYWGGYLIYRLYPRVRMLVDDRHDFYGEDFFKSYLKMMHVEPGWEDFLEQHEAHGVVVPKASALANILAETPRWRPIYSDDAAVVFVRDPALKQ
jgi:hypothetical protein